MIRLATLIESFETDLRAQFGNRLTSEHLRALAAMKQCRSHASPKMQVQCSACPQTMLQRHFTGFKKWSATVASPALFSSFLRLGISSQVFSDFFVAISFDL